MSWSDYDAVLFDLDGVLTPTADVHRRAWATMFDEFLAGRPEPTTPFTDDDYLEYVDGKPRYDGVRSFLQSRGIVLPEGDPSDPPGRAQCARSATARTRCSTSCSPTAGIVPYPGSVRLLDHLAAGGVGTAVVSSSRNAHDVLAAAGLAPRFDVVVEGRVAAEEGIVGKPAPDMFLEAARRLSAARERAVVVEDAVSGVAAGRAGGFALVVGVDRGAGTDALIDSGADVVVTDLAELLPPGAGDDER